LIDGSEKRNKWKKRERLRLRIQGSTPRQRKYQPSLQDPKEKEDETEIPLEGKGEIINQLLKISTIHNRIEPREF
jgi:hypothetical protein